MDSVTQFLGLEPSPFVGCDLRNDGSNGTNFPVISSSSDKFAFAIGIKIFITPPESFIFVTNTAIPKKLFDSKISKGRGKQSERPLNYAGEMMKQSRLANRF